MLAILSVAILSGCASTQNYTQPINFSELVSKPCEIGNKCYQNIDGVEINYQLATINNTSNFNINGKVDFKVPAFANSLKTGTFPVLLLDEQNNVICQRRLYFSGIIWVDSIFDINTNIDCKGITSEAKKSFIPSYRMVVSDGYQLDNYRASAK